MDFPKDKYDVVYADPPWRYVHGADGKSRGMAAKHYSTMYTQNILELPVQNLCKNDGTVLFMWVTFPMLLDGFKVMEAWGFQYKTCAFVWVKQNRKSNTDFVGMGAYTRSNAELCLLGVTKNLKAKDWVKQHSVRQIIRSPVERHSKKPDEARKRIEELCGADAKKIELFARETNEGWDVWGDEV